MRKPRAFTAEFKRQVVEEMLSGITGPAQICRRHNLSSGPLYHWKKQYARGKLNNEPTQEETLLDRINKLEQMLGKLTLENEFLKKALQNTLKEQEKDKFIATDRSLVENVRRGCELMKIARSTFYHKPKEKSLEQLKEEMDLRDQIERICLDFPRYGYRSAVKQLQAVFTILIEAFNTPHLSMSMS